MPDQSATDTVLIDVGKRVAFPGFIIPHTHLHNENYPRADDYGYQAAIHAIGDLGVEARLPAIGSVVEGLGNGYRHMILRFGKIITRGPILRRQSLTFSMGSSKQPR